MILSIPLACSFESLDDLQNGPAVDARPRGTGGADGMPAGLGADAAAGVGGATSTQSLPRGGGGSRSDLDGHRDISLSTGGTRQSGDATGGGGGGEVGGSEWDAEGKGGWAVDGSPIDGIDETGAGGCTAPDASVDDAPALKRGVLLVVATLPMNNRDVAIQARLEDRGFDVRPIKDDDVATMSTLDTTTVVVISPGVWASLVAPTFRTISAPVLVCEPAVYVDIGMVDRTLGSSGIIDSTSLVVNPRATPLAAGLSGSVTVLAPPAARLGYGVPGPEAIRVTFLTNNPTYAPIFAYDTNAAMYGFGAPARRGGFFFSTGAPIALTTEGWLLFDAMMDWLAQ